MKLQCLILAGLVGSCGCATFRQPGDAWWGPDKAKHFTASFVLAAGTSAALKSSSESEATASAGGLLAASATGTAKEVYDQNIKRTYFSGKDMVWNLVGGLLGGLTGAALVEE